MAEVNSTPNTFEVKSDSGNTINVIPKTPSTSSSKLYDEQATVGNSVSGPNPSPTGVSSTDRLNNAVLKIKDTTDPYAYAKPSAFNSTHTGLNFDRYSNHSQFRNLGFSPFRDNETIYNNNSSWFDDFGRAASQYGTLFSAGATSLFKNWGSLSNTTPDFDSANTMEKAMAIGSSSKSGFGASFTNFFLNSAYTVGVIAEIAAEEIALGLATGASGGGAAPAALTRTGLNIGRFTKAIGQLFKGANNISTARKVWNVAKKITPFGDTADLARGLIKGERATLRGIYKDYNSLDNFAKSKALFGQFYRDVREINAASSESKLEAGMVSNEVSAKLIDEFYRDNGRMPNFNESQVIHSQALQAGSEAYLYNMPAIYFSNKLVLEGALKGIKPFRSIMNKVPNNLRPVIKTVDGKKTAKVYDMNNIKSYLNLDSIRMLGKALRPKNLVGTGIRYTSANFAEGLQEVYQESLSAGLIDHYTNKNFGQERLGQAGLLNSLRLGAAELDKQNMALETFLSGFFMAAPIGGLQTIAFKKAPRLYQKYRNPEKYKQYIDDRKNAITKLENSLNAIINDPAKFANDFYANATEQNNLITRQLESEEAGDIAGAKNIKEQSFFEHVHTLLKHNMLDEFQTQMRDLLKLDDTSLKEAFGNGRESIEGDSFNAGLRDRINKAISRADRLKERYEESNEKFVNDYNPDTERDLYEAFEEGKKAYLFNEFMFERVGSRIQSMTGSLASNPKLSQVLGGDIAILFDTTAGGALQSKIKNLESEIKIYEQATTAEDKEILKQKQEEYEGLNTWYSAITAFERTYDESVKLENFDPSKAEKFVLQFPKGSPIEYTNTKGEKVEGKFVGVLGKNILIEIVNKKGKKQRVAVDRSKTAFMGEQDIDLSAQEIQFGDQTTLVDSMVYMLEALFGQVDSSFQIKGIEPLKGYLNTLAGPNGLNMTKDEMGEIFANVLDIVRLRKDSARHINALNILTDPDYFNSNVEKIGQLISTANRLAKIKVKAMLDDYERMMDNHHLLQELYEIGIFLDPNNVDALVNKNKIPSSFYAATNLPNIPELTQIDPSNPQHKDIYNKILEVLESYEALKGIEFVGKVDPTAISQTIPLGQQFQKQKGDERTILDLATEYGFNKDNPTDISAKELLQKIIDSQFGYLPDKQLARRLLSVIKDDINISFNRNHPVAVSYDTTNGIVINPNFSAANYRTGILNIEKVILNGLMQKLVNDNLTNAKFKADIENIKTKVQEAIVSGKLNAIIEQLEQQWNVVFPKNEKGDIIIDDVVGLKSIEQFVAMAMTDLSFQSILANTITEETNKSVWQEFLESLRNLLEQITGLYKGGNALEETLRITSTAILGEQITETQTTAEEINVATPLQQLPEDLTDALNVAWNELSPEDKQSYGSIDSWIQGSSAAATIINNYKKKKEKKEVGDDKKGLIQNTLTVAQLSYLRNKSGLEESDIFSMELPELIEIVNGKFRVLAPNENQNLTSAQLQEGRIIKTFNGITMTNVPIGTQNVVNPAVQQQLVQIGSKLEAIFSNVLGRGDASKVALLKNQAKAVGDNIINQIKQIYNINQLQYDENISSKIRTLLSDPSKYFFRVTSLNNIVEEIRKSTKDNIQAKLSEAIEKVLKEPDLSETSKNYTDRGTVIDEFFRMGLRGMLDQEINDTYVNRLLDLAYQNVQSKLNVQTPIIFSDKFKKDLTKTLKHVVDYMRINNYRALTDTNELFGSIGIIPVSGQVDLVLYNDKGDLLILDIKTMMPKNDRAKFKGYAESFEETLVEDRVGYVEKDTAQLNIYRELIQSLVGTELNKNNMRIQGMGILPLLVNMSIAGNGTRTISSIEISPSVSNVNNKNKPIGLYIPIIEKTTVELFPELYPQAPPATGIDATELARRKKLVGWTASYELATIAKREGIDLSKLSREEYANYAIKNGLKIDDSQLRTNPKHRNATSSQEVGEMLKADRASLSDVTKKAFNSFYNAIMAIVNKPQAERYLAQNVRLYSDTKNSNSWLYFGINNGTNTNESFTHKSYFSLKNLNDFSPELFRDFMIELQKRGYNGGVKIFQDLEVQGPALSDQVVMHGYSENDAKLALQVAKEFYGDKILESSYGKDEVINGKNMSYSQILSDKIKERVDSGNTQPLEGTTPPPAAPVVDVVTVYHHTNVKPEDFNFGTFQRGKEQVSQFGDGLNASSTTTPFLVQRYGQPIQGEIKDSDFIVIDANKTEKELYNELRAKGYNFNNPATGSYIGNDPAKEYDGTEKANEQPAIISLFNDFQKSNPEVKGVKVVNHIIGNQKVDPFYVIYDAKSFYGPGSLSKKAPVSDQAKKADIEIGKIANTEYEVKSDGVYYQGKKLNNPQNKTHRQLIETDIERRKQSELKFYTGNDLKQQITDLLNSEVPVPEITVKINNPLWNKQRAAQLEALDNNARIPKKIIRAAFINTQFIVNGEKYIIEKDSKYAYSNVRKESNNEIIGKITDGGYDYDGETINKDAFLKLLKNVDSPKISEFMENKINAKYKAELAALEGAKSTTPVSDIERRRQESINSIVETYNKGNDLIIGNAIITKADGTTESISDLKDVVTTGDPFQRLKDKINSRYKELAALEASVSNVEVKNTISNGDKIISVQTKPVTDEITDTAEDLFILPDNNPEGRIHINMEPLKDILVVPNNTLTIIDKKTGKEIINKELNPEGAVIFEAMQGRLFVVANINGQLVPFYKSSAGTSGKTQGAWYPFFGYTGAWLVKGGIDKATGKMSYSPEIDKVTDLLNENLVFPDKYIDRATNSIKNTKGEIIIDMNQAFKVNRLWQKEFGSQTGTGTNYEIKGLKENTRSESGLVALITGLNTTELDSSKTPKENSEWFNLISKNAELATSEGKKEEPIPSIINSKTLRDNKIIYISPVLTIPNEIKDDSAVLFYDDYAIAAINNLGFLKEAVTRDNYYQVINDVFYSGGYTSEQVLAFRNAINETAYNSIINALNESPEKVIITSNITFLDARAKDVSIAIVYDNIEEYPQKKLAVLEQTFKKQNRLRVADSKNIVDILDKDLDTLPSQRKETVKISGENYESWIKTAELPSLFLLINEIDSMEDLDFQFEKTDLGNLSEKNYLYLLVRNEIISRMKKGIVDKKTLKSLAPAGSVVIMENSQLYPRGFGYVTKSGNVMPLYPEQSSGDTDFKTYGKAPSSSNKVIAIMQSMELGEGETTTDENIQAKENLESIKGNPLSTDELSEIANNPEDITDALNNFKDNLC